MASALHYLKAEATMLNLLRQLFIFRVAQRATATLARKIGFPHASLALGLIGGVLALRRRS